MKQKNASFLIASLLLFSMIFSMTVSVRADYSYDYYNTYFDYGVAEGDILEYNLNFVFDFTADPTFYTAMDTWISAMAASQNISIGTFDLETFMGDFEEFLELDYKLQFEITEMYSGISNSTYYLPEWDTRYYDYINASIRTDLNNGAGWETPDAIAADRLNKSKALVEPYLNATEFEYFEEMIDMAINETTNPAYQPDWNNMHVFGMQSQRFFYDENGTLEVDTPEQLLNGTMEPEIPFPTFAGPESGVPLFFPNEMNFQEYYDYATDMFKFMLLFELEQGYSIDPFVATDTLQSIIADGGVNQIYVDNKSAGVLWDIGSVDPDLLEEAWGENYTDEMAAQGIADYVGSIAGAVEYDENWALDTFAVYAHIGITLDTLLISEAPQLNNEAISLDLTFTIAQEGSTPPSENNIENGQIGENSGFEIPGFPTWFVGLFGIISIAALIRKHRK